MDVSPSVLEFQGSFTNQTTEYLTLTNNTREPLAFKVKTTAPKLYCVRPNAGLVEPGEDVEISIILQGFSQPLPADYKCKDKFLIVSLPAPKVRDPSRVSEEWGRLEQSYGDKLVSKKLRVNYFVTDDHSDVDSDRGHHDRSNGHGHGHGHGAAAAAGGAGVGAAAGAAAASQRHYDSAPVDRDISHHQAPAQDSYQQQAPPAHQQPVAAAPPPQQYSVQQQPQGDYQPQKAIVTEPIQGISIQLAALLCLLSFLLGWLAL